MPSTAAPSANANRPRPVTERTRPVAGRTETD